MEKMVAEKAISGTFGECWINGEKLGEVFGLQAKWNLLKEDVMMCGTRNGRGKKVMGAEGSGSLRFNKVDSKLLKALADGYKSGKHPIFTITSKLSDPAVSGAERVVLKNVVFDDITLIDWEANRVTTEEKPFTFDDFDLIETIR